MSHENARMSRVRQALQMTDPQIQATLESFLERTQMIDSRPRRARTALLWMKRPE